MGSRKRIALLVALAAGVGLFFVLRSSGSEDMYRVDAVFDTGRGVLPGGRVKIAGANVGVIDDIRLTSGRKALVQMRVDKRFAPFRSDAHCSIRTEGLVGAAVVNCQPGSQKGALLQTGERGHPTLPLARTSVPVSITDFFEIWQAPVRDRLRIVLNELGMGVAGRGDDLNELLLRANPALGKARHALAIIVAQRKTLAASISDSNRAIAALAADRDATRTLISEAAKTARVTAVHDRALGRGIAGLPPLLTRSRNALTELDALSRTAKPLVADLRVSAPALESLTDDTPSFAKDAMPSVRALTPSLKEGNATVAQLGPFVRSLERFTKSADPAGRLQGDLQVSLRDSGTYESLLRLFYAGTASTARYDAVSHMDPSHIVAAGCLQYAVTHVDGCDYHYVKQQGTTAKKKTRRPAAKSPAPDRAPGQTGTTTTAPAKPKLPVLPLPKTGIDGVDDAIHDLLDYLLG